MPYPPPGWSSFFQASQSVRDSFINNYRLITTSFKWSVRWNLCQETYFAGQFVLSTRSSTRCSWYPLFFLFIFQNSQEFQGFGLTIGSDLYLVVDRRAHRAYYHPRVSPNLTYTHGQFISMNGSTPFSPLTGVIGQMARSNGAEHIVKGKMIRYDRNL